MLGFYNKFNIRFAILKAKNAKITQREQEEKER